MAQYEVISKSLHQGKFWRQIESFSFAAKDATCALTAIEATRAAVHLPIAFIKSSDSYELIALQGLEPGQNYLVDHSGNWLAGYIPAPYRAYPFKLANSTEDQLVLCIDIDSGLLSDSEGNVFFNSEAKIGSKLQEMLDILSIASNNQVITRELCELFQKLDLIEPWPITITKNKQKMSIEGIFRISEERFNKLEPSNLALLRDNGALPLLFSQLLSMQNLRLLLERADQIVLPSDTELLFDLPSDEGNISFESL